jgi:hypothetical protein
VRHAFCTVRTVAAGMRSSGHAMGGAQTVKQEDSSCEVSWGGNKSVRAQIYRRGACHGMRDIVLICDDIIILNWIAGRMFLCRWC